MAKQESMLELASQIEKEYKEGLDYKKQMRFLSDWAEYERFKAGNQWPAPTEKTKNLPRPVFNIIEQIQGHKVSSVMNENIKMVYLAEELPDPEEQEQMAEIGEEPPESKAADLYTRYADAMWEEIKQDTLNEQVLDSASNTGTGIWHYYWDATVSGGNKLAWQGKMCGEVIDPVNYFPGNPQSNDVQKQPYNIITSRDLVSSVRKYAEENGLSRELSALIKPDSETTDQAYDMAKQELSNSNKVTVITKYWKEIAQIPQAQPTVHFLKVASGVVIKPKTNTRMRLYPLEVMQWKTRKRSIFGVGDTEGLIPNQKAINFLMAMQLLSVQLTGWPKLAINPALIRQQITNTPGEVVQVQGDNINNAIQYLNPGAISPHAQMLVDNFISYTKEVAGANETALGEQQSSDLNATAIMLLQKAAGVPIESIKRRFYQCIENIGRIWMEFWRVYYNTDRFITVKDDEGEEYSTIFNGEDYADMDMRLKIDVGPSSSYSESLMMTSLDKLFDGGHITLDQYLKYAPKTVVPFKDRLLKDIQDLQEQQQQQMEQMQMDADQQIQQVLAQMTPEEQQAFLSADPKTQQAIIQQFMTQPQPSMV